MLASITCADNFIVLGRAAWPNLNLPVPGIPLSNPCPSFEAGYAADAAEGRSYPTAAGSSHPGDTDARARQTFVHFEMVNDSKATRYHGDQDCDSNPSASCRSETAVRLLVGDRQ